MGPKADPWLELVAQLRLGSFALDVDLRPRARRMSLGGPSGAGKSTCLRILAGLERRARGRLVVDGQVWSDTATRRFTAPWRRGVGWVPQNALLFPHLTVSQNLRYSGAKSLELEPLAAALEVDHLLERPPRGLSGGERQRVALGRALLSEPRLLLLDEPFSALDRSRRARMAEVLSQICQERALPLVLATHDEDTVQILTEEHWELRDGAVAPVS